MNFTRKPGGFTGLVVAAGRGDRPRQLLGDQLAFGVVGAREGQGPGGPAAGDGHRRGQAAPLEFPGGVGAVVPRRRGALGVRNADPSSPLVPDQPQHTCAVGDVTRPGTDPTLEADGEHATAGARRRGSHQPSRRATPGRRTRPTQRARPQGRPGRADARRPIRNRFEHGEFAYAETNPWPYFDQKLSLSTTMITGHGRPTSAPSTRVAL